VFAIVLVVIPGPDFAVITKNTLAGGRRRGAWSAAGVASSNAVQGLAAGWRQGFLLNITNPKVLVFYLAVLPQFLGPEAPVSALLALALSHAALSLVYLLLVVAGLARARRVLARARRVLTRRRVRRALDAVTGTALLGFSAKLATE
jgi:threonine/homoserine/homoserine lactone efflux protein